MNLKSVRCLVITCFITITSLSGSELVWFPVPTDQPDSPAHVEAMFQTGSEVWMMYILGDLVAPNAIGSTAPVEVDFPTLFVTKALNQWEIDPFEPYLGFSIFGEYPEVPKKDSYDYSHGNGIIQHPVFGQLDISKYPWVHSPFFGWRFVKEAGTAWSSNGWWFWERDIGWYFTTRNIYPLIYTKDGLRHYPVD